MEGKSRKVELEFLLRKEETLRARLEEAVTQGNNDEAVRLNRELELVYLTLRSQGWSRPGKTLHAPDDDN